MKHYLKYLFYILVILGSTVAMPACKTKEGCGQEEMYNNPDMETKKRGKSNLFSKSQNKKMKRKS